MARAGGRARGGGDQCRPGEGLARRVGVLLPGGWYCCVVGVGQWVERADGMTICFFFTNVIQTLNCTLL